jgi:predicted GIY-YIG superfamily endonuclease
MGQLLLIPDPRPLDRRLGRKFFRQAPRRPGVYLMKDAGDRVLYVGKAKDLKQRLNHYRTANPDRMPRRHLRMVNEVSRIEFQFCASEAAALKREAKLIRSLKPKFNRAGVWPGRTKFIVWRAAGNGLEISVVETPAAGWQRFGPLGGNATFLQRSLARLLWLATNPGRPLTELPAGWSRGEFMETQTSNAMPPSARRRRRWRASFGLTRSVSSSGSAESMPTASINSSGGLSKPNWKA